MYVRFLSSVRVKVLSRPSSVNEKEKHLPATASEERGVGELAKEEKKEANSTTWFKLEVGGGLPLTVHSPR